MRFSKTWMSLLLSTYSLMAFSQQANETLYCPSGAQYISPGMNIASVQQACGKPSSVKVSKQEGTKKVDVLQWTYRIRASQYQPGQMPIIRHSNAKFTAGGLDQPTMIVTFRDDKVIDVAVNGQSMPASSMCEGNTISVGDNTSAVQYACGPPFYVNRSFQEIPTGKEVKMEVWTVNLGQYQPTATLTFQNGILKSIAK